MSPPLALNDDDGLKAVILGAIGEPFVGASQYQGPTSAPVGWSMPGRAAQAAVAVPPSPDTDAATNSAQPISQLDPAPVLVRGNLKARIVAALTSKGTHTT